MEQTHDAITQNLAERLCWAVARRDDFRLARRLYRKQLVDGVYRLDEGALLDAFLHFVRAIGVMALLEAAHGAAIQRKRVPVVQSVLLYGVKTLLGMPSINALPRLLCSDEALMPLVGFNAQQVGEGVCQRGATTRPGERAPGPICQDTLAKHIVQWDLRHLEMGFKGALRALAMAGVFGATITGIAAGTDLDTTERDTGCGEVTRKVRTEDKRGQVHALAITVYGWKVVLLMDAATTIPWAVNVGQSQEHEARWALALVTHARLKLAGDAPLATVVCDQGFWDGATRWGLDQQGLHVVVPAQTNMAVTAEACAQAVAGDELTVGRRVHTVRHGQGRQAWTERLEPEVVGITGLTA
jgi:hypothetical protein